MTTDYNSFFEIFTAINLAYAGSDTFRDRIDSKILNISSSFVHPKKLIRENIALLNASTDPAVNLFFRRRIHILNFLIKKLESAPRRLECGNLFKSVFLVSGFYSLIFLTCSALIVNQVHQDASKAMIILTSLMALPYNVIVFLLSFTKWSNRKIKTIIPITLYLITVIILVLVICFNCEVDLEELLKDTFWQTEKKYFIYIAFLIALLPILLHVLRSLIILLITWIKNINGLRFSKALYYECDDLYRKLYSGPPPEHKPVMFYSFIIKRFHKRLLSKNKEN